MYERVVTDGTSFKVLAPLCHVYMQGKRVPIKKRAVRHAIGSRSFRGAEGLEVGSSWDCLQGALLTHDLGEGSRCTREGQL